LEYGFQPGKGLGQILNVAYEAQLAGEFNNLTGGLRWLSEAPDIPAEIRERIRAGAERLEK
jgi:hypothetical protein